MSNEDYNPDNFDWEGDSQGINLDDVGPDIIEVTIKAALEAQEAAYGWRYLRKSEVKENAGRLYPNKYFMPKEKREWFDENAPGYTFVWDRALHHHDHPAAHLMTDLNEIAMVEDLVRDGKVWIDLFGNGDRDRKYKRKCFNMFTLATPKDYIRHQRVGQNDVPFDMDKLCDPNSVFGKIDDVTCTHGAYYLTIEDIARIVNTSSTRRFRALVHRHKDTHGFLNAGEQEYWVTPDGRVTQMNVDTGEKYSHPSLEALFHHGSAKTKAGGVGWTIKAGLGDTYEITFVGCPNEICETFVPLMFLKPETWEEYSFASVSVRKFLHWTWMSATTAHGQVTLDDCDLLNKLRRYVAGKQRTPRLKTELMNHARRLCNKADIISIHGGGAHEVQVASMHEYVEVAFYVDVKKELDAAISFHRDNKVMVTALNEYHEQGKLPKDLTMVSGAACWTARTFSEQAIRVLQSLRDSTEIDVRTYLEQNLPHPDLEKLAIDYGPDERVAAPWGIAW